MKVQGLKFGVWGEVHSSGFTAALDAFERKREVALTPLHRHHLAIRVSGFGFRVSGFEFRVSGLRVRFWG